MRLGTKSVLFGAHQFLIHPWFVAFSWWKLYGFPFDPRLWIAFFIHDLGYIGKPNMDGPEGDKHPEFAANIMGFFFGQKWSDFCLCHSRFYSKRDGKQYSKLCVADKLAIVLEPWWLYLPRVLLSGEIHEYMALAGGKNDSKYKGEPNDKYVSMKISTGSYRDWFDGVCEYLKQWVREHKDLKKDTWTPDNNKEMKIEPTKGLGFNSTAPEKNTITFHPNGKKGEILKLCENGDIFVNGKLAENDKEVVDGMREFLISAGCLK